MASRGLDMGIGLVLVLMAMLWAGANAQSCTSALTSLAPCLNYITGNSSTPSSTCCSQLKTVVQSSPQCLCSVLNNGASLGISINRTLAMQLPGSCQVQTSPVSQCNAASPSGSPSDSSDETPEGAMTPSASDIPSGTGSKSFPSTDGESSNASIEKASLNLVLFLVSIAIVNKF
ncbi:non-specific lipid transfer protein GPI-anchored 19-like isoform X2 [Hibiscus syriacus]|uniref:non-specific lipid transfer protein GPI-anchored 19-like isoform X2 n=1 Tax=Hibiscus syriacus TaxID=106335 RepID=UPI001924EDD9|nr:non-specific lipid transfer protein GPI-anchored 19-like isoform X2 [Hibiscus syriacus]